MAPRLDTLDGNTFGLWNNDKLNAAKLLELIRVELEKRSGVSTPRPSRCGEDRRPAGRGPARTACSQRPQPDHIANPGKLGMMDQQPGNARRWAAQFFSI